MINGIYGEGSKEHNVRTFVLDDLGKEYSTSAKWAENTFDALLRSRFNAGFPTIITTNVPLRSWAGIYGEAMGSFAYEAFIPIDIIAKGDRRR
jgi:DNA replication protein DnaC